MLALGLTACSSGPSTAHSTTGAPSPPPACPTGEAHVAVVLSDQQPVPVVRIPSGGCVVVTVPRSPFRHTRPEAPTAVPTGRLRQIADSVRPDGSRIVVYVSRAPGATTISSTVRIHTGTAVPEWSAVVLVT